MHIVDKWMNWCSEISRMMVMRTGDGNMLVVVVGMEAYYGDCIQKAKLSGVPVPTLFPFWLVNEQTCLRGVKLCWDSFNEWLCGWKNNILINLHKLWLLLILLPLLLCISQKKQIKMMLYIPDYKRFVSSWVTNYWRVWVSQECRIEELCYSLQCSPKMRLRLAVNSVRILLLEMTDHYIIHASFAHSKIGLESRSGQPQPTRCRSSNRSGVHPMAI